MEEPLFLLFKHPLPPFNFFSRSILFYIILYSIYILNKFMYKSKKYRMEQNGIDM